MFLAKRFSNRHNSKLIKKSPANSSESTRCYSCTDVCKNSKCIKVGAVAVVIGLFCAVLYQNKKIKDLLHQTENVTEELKENVTKIKSIDRELQDSMTRRQISK